LLDLLVEVKDKEPVELFQHQHLLEDQVVEDHMPQEQQEQGQQIKDIMVVLVLIVLLIMAAAEAVVPVVLEQMERLQDLFQVELVGLEYPQILMVQPLPEQVVGVDQHLMVDLLLLQLQVVVEEVVVEAPVILCQEEMVQEILEVVGVQQDILQQCLDLVVLVVPVLSSLLILHKYLKT
jgi:hypothetical protein